MNKIDLGNLILNIRNKQVVLDSELASIFGVETRVLLQTLKRNLERFPEEFVFQLTNKEYLNLRSQFVISRFHGGRRYSPYVFTEYGVVMIANLLNSKVAVDASVLIVKAFIRLRKMVFNLEGLSKKIEQLEEKDLVQDEQLRLIIDTLKKLMNPPNKTSGKIGFKSHE